MFFKKMIMAKQKNSNSSKKQKENFGFYVKNSFFQLN